MFRADDLASASWPFCCWPRKAGRAIAARMPMMRITTRSSMSVKPFSSLLIRWESFRSMLRPLRVVVIVRCLIDPGALRLELDAQPETDLTLDTRRIPVEDRGHAKTPHPRTFGRLRPSGRDRARQFTAPDRRRRARALPR